MALFINGIGSIAPTLVNGETAAASLAASTRNRLRCIEPDYAAYLDPRVSRRMSRIVKMGIVAAMQAMQAAQIQQVDGVIAGTGWGCLEDTISFLQKMVVNEEEMLSPTAFIHSTHNTIAAQIAYHLKCRGYNSTYVHRNISFESTLIDAMLLLQEKPAATLLVGGIDELTDTSFAIMSRLHTFKAPQDQQPAGLYGAGTSGTWAGEGSSFFVVANQACTSSLAQLVDVRTISFSSPAQAAATARKMLAAHGYTQVDLLISGDNGDVDNDAACQDFAASFDHSGPVQQFKHLCGEYPTASAFALGWATALLSGSGSSTPAKAAPRTILIYNRFQQAHQSLLLLAAC